MAYIAFFDMVGTRASALTSNQEYTDAINSFNTSLKQVAQMCNCEIFGYSDNAYAEIDSLENMIKFFRLLRDTLMKNHRYFSAAVDIGTLNAKKLTFEKSKGFSMKFTESSTIEIYLNQCQFSGIGVSLSQKIVDELKYKKMYDEFCLSVFQKKNDCVNTELEFVSVYDIAYRKVSLSKLRYILSDYLMTAAMSERAGRYYVTPIISMIKGIDKTIIEENIDELISLLSLQTIPAAFKTLKHQELYTLLFMFALIDRVYFIKDKDVVINSKEICEKIIKQYNVPYEVLIEKIPHISTSIISQLNKQRFLNVLYNLK